MVYVEKTTAIDSTIKRKRPNLDSPKSKRKTATLTNGSLENVKKKSKKATLQSGTESTAQKERTGCSTDISYSIPQKGANSIDPEQLRTHREYGKNGA